MGWEQYWVGDQGLYNHTYVYDNSRYTNLAPPPTASYQGIYVTLSAQTGMVDNAKSAHGYKYASFFVGGNWTGPYYWFEFADTGMVVTNTFLLQSTPTAVRISTGMRPYPIP